MNVCWTSLPLILYCLSLTQQTDGGDEIQANALLSYCESVRDWHTFYISALCCALSWWAVGNPCQEPWSYHSDQNKIVGVMVSALLINVTSNSHVRLLLTWLLVAIQWQRTREPIIMSSGAVLFLLFFLDAYFSAALTAFSSLSWSKHSF